MARARKVNSNASKGQVGITQGVDASRPRETITITVASRETHAMKGALDSVEVQFGIGINYVVPVINPHGILNGIVNGTRLWKYGQQFFIVQVIVGPFRRQNLVLFINRKISPCKIGVHVRTIQLQNLVVRNYARIDKIKGAGMSVLH